MAEKKNMNAGHRQRLLQRYLKNGISSLEEHEMLELLLHFAIPYRDTKKQAKILISYFGSLENVLNANVKEIENTQTQYVTERAAALIMLVHDLQRYMEKANKTEQIYIRNYDAAGEYALSVLEDSAVEKLYLVNLSPKCKIIYTELISEGNSSSVDIVMSKIINSVILHKAAQVLMMHNHPSGNLNPSLEDITQTKYVEKRLREIGVTLSDHIIVAGGEYISMRNRGFIY